MLSLSLEPLTHHAITQMIPEYFDSLYYDVGNLSAADRSYLNTCTCREGDILVVYPANAARQIQHFASVTSMFEAELTPQPCAITVSGIGSSCVGSAALARNVANALDAPVIAVISGYGTYDLAAEALGGWFVYGYKDAWRHAMRQHYTAWNSFYKQHIAAGLLEVFDNLPMRDTHTIIELLASPSLQLRLILGHSKGNLVNDFALEYFATKYQQHDYYQQLKIVSVGAVTNFPPKFRQVEQYLGQFDLLGAINSRPSLTFHSVPGALHSTNSKTVAPMKVEALL